MPRISRNAVDHLERELRTVFRSGTTAARMRVLRALGGDRRHFAKNLALLQRAMMDLSSADAAAPVRSLSELSRREVGHLTHLIAFGMDGNKVTLMLDLPRASAREVVAAVAGSRQDTRLSPNEAARRLGISRTHLRHLMDSGVLPFTKVGTHHRLDAGEVARLKMEWKRRSAAMAEMAHASADIDT